MVIKTTEPPEAKALHVENVPGEVLRDAKSVAAWQGVTFREFVIGALRSASSSINPKPKRRSR